MDDDTQPDTNAEDDGTQAYIIFGPNNHWTQLDGVRFEYNKYGDLLFFDAEGKVTGAVTRGHSNSVMLREGIDQECLYNWGIEKRPAKSPEAIQLIEQRKVLLDEVENTSDGFRAVVFNVETDKDDVVGEFNTFEEAVKAVWQHKEKVRAGSKGKIEPDQVKTDEQGYYKRADILPTMPEGLGQIPVWLKYQDGTTGRGWYTSEGHFKCYATIMGIEVYTMHPKKLVVAWKKREIYPPLGPK